jgi:hypothetical protein
VTTREPTLQQQDPLEVGGWARLFAAGGTVLALLVAAGTTLARPDEIADWGLEASALVALVLAGVVVILAASPFRAPFGRVAHVLVLVLGVAAFTLDEMAQLGTNALVHDDWGLTALPVLLLVLAPLRPPRELLLGGIAATLAVGWVAASISPFVAVPMSPVARAVVAMTSVLAPACAASVFATVVLRRRRAVPAVAVPVGLPDEVRLSVQQETIARLEAEVVPLLREIVADGSLTTVQGHRARALATGLRSALVAELQRDWMREAGFAVTDPQGSAERMTAEQRAALRSTLAALPLLDPEHPGTARLSARERGAVAEVAVPVQRRPSRGDLAPMMPMLRTVFTRAEVRADEHAVVLLLEFSTAH